jgi:hypothetical protein
VFVCTDEVRKLFCWERVKANLCLVCIIFTAEIMRTLYFIHHVSVMSVACLAYPSTLLMDVEPFFETSVNLYWTTWDLHSRTMFLNRRAAAQYLAVASIILGRERLFYNSSFSFSKPHRIHNCTNTLYDML